MVGWKKPFPYLSCITHLAGQARLALDIGRVPERRALPTAQELEERERSASSPPGLPACCPLLQQEASVMGHPSSLLPQAGPNNQGCREQSTSVCNRQLWQWRLNSEVDGYGPKLARASPALLPGARAKPSLHGHTSSQFSQLWKTQGCTDSWFQCLSRAGASPQQHPLRSWFPIARGHQPAWSPSRRGAAGKGVEGLFLHPGC